MLDFESTDFTKFKLLSKLPLQPEFNQIKFIPTIHKTLEKPEDGYIFNHKIGCADDLVFYASRECDNCAELIALDIVNKVKTAIMQASTNLVTSKAKYIMISTFVFENKNKNKNKNLIVFENEHKNVDPTFHIEYQIENYISK